MKQTTFIATLVLFLSSCGLKETAPPELAWPPERNLDLLSDEVNGTYKFECKYIEGYGELCMYDGWIKIYDAFGENPRYKANYKTKIGETYPEVIFRDGPTVRQNGSIKMTTQDGEKEKPFWVKKDKKYLGGHYEEIYILELVGLPEYRTELPFKYDFYTKEFGSWGPPKIFHYPTMNTEVWKLTKQR